MTDVGSPVFYLPGAGGGAPDLSVFKAGEGDATVFEVIRYPGWERHSSGAFAPDTLIAEIAAYIASKAPRGPVRIIGLSIGGHFGYATALHLQRQGRAIAGFCAIDTFMISSAGASAGWQGRALAEGLALLRKKRIAEFGRFMRTKFWRALLRITGDRLTLVTQRLSSRHASAAAMDPVLESELSMRMLLRETAPWISTLDLGSEILAAPSVLLRTEHTAADDEAWRRRCPTLDIVEVPGGHHTLFDPENVGTLHRAFIAATPDWR